MRFFAVNSRAWSSNQGTSKLKIIECKFCKDCVYCKRNTTCRHPNVKCKSRDYHITGDLYSPHCLNTNTNGYCNLYEKKPKVPTWKKWLKYFPFPENLLLLIFFIFSAIWIAVVVYEH